MPDQRKGLRVGLITLVIATTATNILIVSIVGFMAIIIVGAALVVALRRSVYPSIRIGSTVLGWWQPDDREQPGEGAPTPLGPGDRQAGDTDRLGIEAQDEGTFAYSGGASGGRGWGSPGSA
jgi:hypothetical protein